MKKCLMKLSVMSILAFNQFSGAQEVEVVRKKNKPRATQIEPNIEARLQDIKDLVSKAVPHFLNNDIEIACRDFAHGSGWRLGNIFVFVFDADGNVLVHGDDTTLIWQSINNIKGVSGQPIIKDMLVTGSKGGWVNYPWQGGYKSAYVQRVEKDGRIYVVGSGFFPESRVYSTVQLVNNIIASFEHNRWEQTLALIDDKGPHGPFVKGDIYAFVFDLEGNCIAHGENSGMIGQNLLEVKDSNGLFLVQELIKVAKSKEGKGWVEYVWKNAKKRSYVQRYVNPKTKIPYLVSAGYYPNIDESDVRIFVQRAIKHLQNNGAKQAFADFSNPVGDFVRGGLFIEVYSMQGRIMADGDNPGFVNQEFLNRKDLDGKYTTQEILEIANKYGKGLVNVSQNNSIKVLYLEKVVVPDGVFVIVSGYYPASKKYSVQSLVNRAADHLKVHEAIEAFKEFSNPNNDFWKGDIHLFVYTDQGSRLVAGLQTEMIWQNFYRERDQEGKPVIDNLIALAKAGGGWARYKSRNAIRRVFVRSVEKINPAGAIERYIFGSGYYL